MKTALARWPHTLNVSLLTAGGPDEGDQQGTITEDANKRFRLVHGRPFFVSYEPDDDVDQQWRLTINMTRLSSLDETHEIIGQVLRGFGEFNFLYSSSYFSLWCLEQPVGHDESSCL